jgi:hypothetical protein
LSVSAHHHPFSATEYTNSTYTRKKLSSPNGDGAASNSHKKNFKQKIIEIFSGFFSLFMPLLEGSTWAVVFNHPL